MAPSINLVLADDHPIVLDGLRSLLVEPAFRIVATGKNGREALEACVKHRPDVLVLDLQMPQMSGIQTLRSLPDLNLPTRIVVLTASLNDADVLEAVRLGAHGMVFKDVASQELVDCITTVAGGGRWVNAEIAGRAIESMLQQQRIPDRADPALTQRERDVAHLVALGRRNKEIARELSVTEGTVKMYLHSIYAKLNISNRMELVIYVRDNGLLSSSPHRVRASF